MYDPQQAANMVTQGVSDLGAPIQGAMELPPFIQQLMDGVARGELDPDHAGMMANGHVQQMAGNIPGLRAAMGGAAPMQQPQPVQAPPSGVSPMSYGPPTPGGARASPGAMVSGPAFNSQQAPVQRAQPQVRTYGDLAMLERVAPTLSKMKNDKVALKQLDIADRQLRADEERKRKTSEGEANRGLKRDELDAKDRQFKTKLSQHVADMNQHWQEVLAKLASAEKTATNKNATTADLMAAKLVVQQQLGIMNNQTKLVVNNPGELAKDPETMQQMQQLQQADSAVQKHAQQLDAVISRRLAQPPPTNTTQNTTQTGPTPTARAAQVAGPQGRTLPPTRVVNGQTWVLNPATGNYRRQ
jgi:hypothetical protein